MSEHQMARIRLLAAGFACLGLAACAGVRKFPGVGAPETETLLPPPASIVQPEAIVVVEPPREKGVPAAGPVSRSVAEVEETKKSADRARFLGNYSQAAETYGLLLARWADYAAFAGRLTFGKADVAAAIRECRVGMYGAQSRREMELGNYSKAMAVYRAALEEYPGHTALAAGYAGVTAELKAAVGKASAAGEHARAGRINAALLAHLPMLQAQGLGTGLDKAKLAASIKESSIQLTNKGLEEYRKGNLEKAIVLWESLLAFDPENAEVLKAVETSRAQLGKLKKSAPAR